MLPHHIPSKRVYSLLTTCLSAIQASKNMMNWRVSSWVITSDGHIQFAIVPCLSLLLNVSLWVKRHIRWKKYANHFCNCVTFAFPANPNLQLKCISHKRQKPPMKPTRHLFSKLSSAHFLLFLPTKINSIYFKSPNTFFLWINDESHNFPCQTCRGSPAKKAS